MKAWLADGWAGFATAAALLTRLPISCAGPHPDPTRGVWAYPVIGGLLGLLGGAVYWAGWHLGLPPAIAAGWAVVAQLLLTGALHEDGLADVADGFGGGRSRARKLEIMRDSRIGSFGALALIVSTGLRGAALASMGGPATVLTALTVAGALSRGAILLVLPFSEPARPDGLAAALAPVRDVVCFAGLGIASLAGFALLPAPAAMLAVALAILAALGMRQLATSQIGGYTGDVLGATTVVTECLVLSLLARP